MVLATCATTSRKSARRPGVTTAGLLISTTVLLAVAALSLDLVMLMMTQQEAQSACDAAALAGADQLWDVTLIGEPRRSQLGLPSTPDAQMRDVVWHASRLARLNTVAGEPITLDENRDLEVTLPEPNVAHGMIKVTCPFTAARGNPLRHFVGSILGVADVDAVLQSRAALDQRVYGFQPAGATPVPLAPLVVDSEIWFAQVDSGVVAFTLSAASQEAAAPTGETAAPKSKCTLCTLTPAGSGGDPLTTVVGVVLSQDQVDLGLQVSDLQSLGGRFALGDNDVLDLKPSSPPDVATVAWIGARLNLAAEQGRCLVWPLGKDVAEASASQVFRRISGFSAGVVERCEYNDDSHTLTVQVTPLPLITSTALVRPGQPRNAWVGKVYLLP